MRRNMALVGAFLVAWPVLLLLAATLVKSLQKPLLGFFASGTVIIAFASVIVGLVLLAISFVSRERRGPA